MLRPTALSCPDVSSFTLGFRRNPATVFATAALAMAAGHARAQTYSYTGPVGGGWHNAAHWSPSGIPGISPPGVAAVVGPGTSVQMLSGDTPNLHSLQSQSQVRIWTGVILNSDSTITDLDLIGTGTGGFHITGLLTLTGSNSIWRSGRIHGDVRNNGTLTIGGSNGTSGNPFFVGHFRNEQVINHTAAAFTQATALVENHGTWTLQGDIQPNFGPEGGGQFKNFSTLRRLGAGEGQIRTPFHSQGTIFVSTGTISVNTNQTILDGVVTLENAGSLAIYGGSTSLNVPPARHGCTVTGAGNYNLYSGSHLIHAPFTANLAQQSNPPTEGLRIETGSGSVEIAASMVNSGLTTFRSGRLFGGFPLVNAENAALHWYGGAVESGLVSSGQIILKTFAGPFLNAGSLFITSSGSLDFSSGQVNSIAGGTGSLVCQGRLVKGAASVNASNINVPLQLNDGARVEVDGNTLTFARTTTFSGNTQITIGAANAAKVTLGAGIHSIAGGQHTVHGGGTLEIVGAAELTINDGVLDNYLSSVSPVPGLLVRGTVIAQGQDRFLNHGVMTMQGGQIFSSPGGFVNHANLTITGGRFVGVAENEGFIRIFASSILNLGQSSGASGALHNRYGGIVELSGGSQIQTTTGSYLLNDGLITKTGAGTASISGAGSLNNTGAVIVSGGSLNISASIDQIQPDRGGNLTLTGGSWTAFPGATLTFSQGPIRRIGTAAAVFGSTTTLPWVANITSNRGRLTVLENSTQATPLRTSEGSTTIIQRGVELTVPSSVENGSPESILDEIIEVFVPSETNQPRLITPLLINHARLIPGDHGEPGPFNLTGDLEMRPTARIVLELGGTEPLLEHDIVAITGAASLDGALQLELIDNFQPVPGQLFTVLTATGGISGTFSSVFPPTGSAGLSFTPIYSANSLVIQVGAAACYPNCDASTIPPILNIADFSCFLQKFAAQDPYANCDASTIPPVFNVADFSCFLQRFAAGCR